jgi:peroxiredoxin Q/BCP
MKKVVILIVLILLVSCGGTAENISVGEMAPDFTLNDSENNTYTLSDFRGKSPVVIYFYPKAGTSGCTTQACGIRDQYSDFKEFGIVVLGISVDSKEEIKEFVKDNNLNFPLLSDADKVVAKQYDVLNNIGLASRVTFILDKEGKIVNIIRNVEVDSHANQVFEFAKKLI